MISWDRTALRNQNSLNYKHREKKKQQKNSILLTLILSVSSSRRHVLVHDLPLCKKVDVVIHHHQILVLTLLIVLTFSQAANLRA